MTLVVHFAASVSQALDLTLATACISSPVNGLLSSHLVPSNLTRQHHPGALADHLPHSIAALPFPRNQEPSLSSHKSRPRRRVCPTSHTALQARCVPPPVLHIHIHSERIWHPIASLPGPASLLFQHNGSFQLFPGSQPADLRALIPPSRQTPRLRTHQGPHKTRRESGQTSDPPVPPHHS